MLVVCVVFMIAAAAGRARADEPPSAERQAAERDAVASLAAGLALFSVGTAIQSAYFGVAEHQSDRLLVRLPIVGPIAVVAEGHTSLAWSTALSFSAATQALGVIAISIAIPRLLELRR
jgi:hypothetical protein